MVKARDMTPAALRRKNLAAYPEIELLVSRTHMHFPSTMTGIIHFQLYLYGQVKNHKIIVTFEPIKMNTNKTRVLLQNGRIIYFINNIC